MSNGHDDSYDSGQSGGHDNEGFARVAGRRLREAATRLDPEIVASLDRARRDAVQAAHPDTMSGGWRMRAAWAPLVAAAGVAGVVLAVTLSMLQTTDDLPLTVADDSPSDMEIVLAGDNLEMFEDLEFYAWLTDQTDAG